MNEVEENGDFYKRGRHMRGSKQMVDPQRDRFVQPQIRGAYPYPRQNQEDEPGSECTCHLRCP